MGNKTLIVNYFGMRTGGIERYLAGIMQFAADAGYRVVWFTSKGMPEQAEQPGIADNPKIEKVYFGGGRRKHFTKNPDLRLFSNDDVVMLSFTQEDFVWAEQFRYKYKCNTFYHYFILMNFFGWLTYPEDEFKTKFLAKKRGKFSKSIAEKIDENNNIRAFAHKQLVTYKERYDLKLKVSEDNILKGFSTNEPLSYEELEQKAQSRKEGFVLVACARFQFPHKGFLIGLLEVFKELKEKYTSTKLIIIGDGERDYFNQFYDKLDDEIKASIELKGTLFYDEMLSVYKQSHLCISLAGAVTAAASIALPALIARHDTLMCETYGFYQNVEGTLKSEPGEDIMPFIEKVISVSNEEYIQLALAGRKEYESRVVIEPDYIFKQTNKSSMPTVSKSDMRKNKMWAVISILKKYFKFL